jgi:F0F1-type ATP synthase delta subunit
MKVTRKELVAVIGKRTMHVMDVHALAGEIAAYMVTTNQRIDLDSLLRDVKQYRLEHGIVEATVVSAHELTPTVIADVHALLQREFPDATTINVESRIDPDVVGGVRIELPRERLDLTVQAKLNTFKRLTSPERN